MAQQFSAAGAAGLISTSSKRLLPPAGLRPAQPALVAAFGISRHRLARPLSLSLAPLNFTTTEIIMTYATREEWLNAAVVELRPLFDSVGYPLPDLIRVTCGFPSSKARSQHKSIGEHWSPANSSDNHHEILISPVIADPIEVFGIWVHELCHAATDGDGHQGRFPTIIRKVWLEGKPTSTYGGEAFKRNFTDMVESLGTYPHASLNVSRVHKTQTTRMLKALCEQEVIDEGDIEPCGYTVRLTTKWAEVGLPYCPLCKITLTLKS
jgi:hypothetical protein